MNCCAGPGRARLCPAPPWPCDLRKKWHNLKPRVLSGCRPSIPGLPWQGLNHTASLPGHTATWTHGGRGAASKEGHAVPGGNKNPGSREVRELRKVPSDVLCGSPQHGRVSGLPVVDVACTPVVHICPEGCYHTAVFGNGEGHGGELRNLLQEGDDPVIVHL